MCFIGVYRRCYFDFEGVYGLGVGKKVSIFGL